ncbi:DNA-binding protein [Solimonas marina]|uniref:KfrA N-terminal DNA-binding domain-containing protein n=1 Tax=Solimonas marina TaxID=2714601 RepID=A0A970B7Y8_9GAMM|nr:DNA-binding protein [Solimonas marina]NKF24413.1 hypothetical protein [Solimonas marina]
MPSDATPISFDQVAAAAQSLQQAGAKVTTLTVREKLGRGSFSTIKKFIDQWRQAGALEVSTSSGEVPPQLETLWLAAQRAAEERLSREREALETLAGELESRLAQMEGTVQDATRARQHAEDRIRDKDAELARLSSLLQATTARADRTDANLKAAQLSHDAALLENRNLIDRLADTLQRIEGDMKPLSGVLSDFRHDVANLSGEIKAIPARWAEGIEQLRNDIVRQHSTMREDVVQAIAVPLTGIKAALDELGRRTTLQHRSAIRQRQRGVRR